MVQNSSFGYDPVGDRSSQNQPIGNYGYTRDAGARLTNHSFPGNSVAQSFGTSSWNLDEITNSNFTTQTDEAFGWDQAGCNLSFTCNDGYRISTDGSFNYQYDDEGRMISRTSISTGQHWEFEWDHRDRMIRGTRRAAVGGAINRQVEYTYDPLNRRIRKLLNANGPLSGGSTLDERFIYDGDHICMVADGNNATILRYFHGPGIDNVVAEDRGGGVTLWAIADHLGTVRDVVDNQGVLVNRTTYSTFGMVLSETNAANSMRFKFTGREWDWELPGMYYYRARYYLSNTYQFMSEDPLGFAAGDFNKRRYCFNRPFELRDPSGMSVIVPPLVTPEQAIRELVRGADGLDRLSGVDNRPIPRPIRYRDTEVPISDPTFDRLRDDARQEPLDSFFDELRDRTRQLRDEFVRELAEEAGESAAERMFGGNGRDRRRPPGGQCFPAYGGAGSPGGGINPSNGDSHPSRMTGGQGNGRRPQRIPRFVPQFGTDPDYYITPRLKRLRPRRPRPLPEALRNRPRIDRNSFQDPRLMGENLNTPIPGVTARPMGPDGYTSYDFRYGSNRISLEIIPSPNSSGLSSRDYEIRFRVNDSYFTPDNNLTREEAAGVQLTVEEIVHFDRTLRNIGDTYSATAASGDSSAAQRRNWYGSSLGRDSSGRYRGQITEDGLEPF